MIPKNSLGSPDAQVTFLLPLKMPAPFLRETLESIVNQDFDRWELLVVFDGRCGDAPDLIRTIVPATKLRMINAEGGTGIVAGLNTGLAAIRTTFTARIDADDLCHPERISRQLLVMESESRPVVVCTGANIIDESGQVIGEIVVPARDEFKRRLLDRNHVVHSSVMFRTREVRMLGGYNASCDAIEDYDLWLRCARIGEIYPIEEPLVSYRISGAQVSRRASRRTSRGYVCAGKVELARALDMNVVLALIKSMLWALAQEPSVRNRFGRLRNLRK